MTEHLTLETLLRIATRALGTQQVLVRDYGLLGAAIARPAAIVFGEDAYPQLHTKAAALLHSLATNHALVDGNKRLAWLATTVFLLLNDEAVETPDDEAFDLVVSVASGVLADLEKIAATLRGWALDGPGSAKL